MLALQGKEASNQFLQTSQPVVGLNWLRADEYLPLPSVGFERTGCAALDKL